MKRQLTAKQLQIIFARVRAGANIADIAAELHVPSARIGEAVSAQAGLLLAVFRAAEQAVALLHRVLADGNVALLDESKPNVKLGYGRLAANALGTLQGILMPSAHIVINNSNNPREIKLDEALRIHVDSDKEQRLIKKLTFFEEEDERVQ